MSQLHFETNVDFSKLDKDIALMDRKMNGFFSGIEKRGDGVTRMFRTLGTAMGAYLSFQAVKELGGEILNVTGQFQKYEAVLANSLGSQKEAAEAMQMLSEKAATTPAQLSELADAYVRLVNQGFKPSSKELTKLSDVASSTGKNITQLSEAIIDAQTGEFERLKEFGIRASKEGDKVAFTFKGVQTQVGFTAKEIQNYIVGLGDLEGVAGSSAAIMGTFVGQISNLQDALAQMFNEIGQNNEGMISDTIGSLTTLVENYKVVADILKVLVATYGTYKAALMATVAWEKAKAASEVQAFLAKRALTNWEIIHTAVIYKLNAAQKLLNSTIKANPYVAAATAISALIGGLMLYNKYAVSSSKVSEEFKNNLTSEVAEIKKNFEAARNSAAGSEARRKAIQDINEKYKEYLPNLLSEKDGLDKIAEAQNAVTEAMAKSLSFKAQEKELASLKESTTEAADKYAELLSNIFGNRNKYSSQQQGAAVAALDQLIEKTGSANVGIQQIKESLGSVGIDVGLMQYNNLFSGINSYITSLRDEKKAIEDLSNVYNAYLEKLGLVNGSKDGGSGEGGKKTKKSRTVEVIDEEIKALKQQQQSLSDTAKKWDDYQRKIDKLAKEREGITGTKKDDKKNTAKVGVWDEKDAFEKDLQDFATYQDKRLSIIEKYSQSRQRLEAQGYEAQAAEASAQMQKELDELDAAQFKKSESYRWVYDNIDKMGRKALKDYIARLKKEIDAFQGNEEVKLELTKKLADADEKLAEYTPDKLREGAGLLQEMAGLAGQFDEGLGKALDTAANLATGLAGAIQGFAPGGNTLQGVTSVVSMVSTVASLFKKNKKPQSEIIDEWIAKMQKFLQLQEKSLNLFSDSGKIGEYDKLMSTVNKQIDALNKRIQDVTNAYNHYYEILYKSGTFTDRIGISSSVDQWSNDDWLKALSSATGDHKKQLESLYSEWITLQEAQQEYANQQNELLTGTTYDSIVSSIVDGFADGLFSAEDFADSFEELMRKALLKSLEIQALQKPLQDWYNQFAAANADGLTQSEIASLQSAYSAIINSAGEYAKSLEQAAGITLSKAEDGEAGGLSGAIKGMSQESADLLAGQLGAMRIHLADIASVVTGGFNSDLRLDTADMEQSFGLGLNAINNAILQSNDYLRQIEINTSVMNDVRSILQDINRKGGGEFFEQRMRGR